MSSAHTPKVPYRASLSKSQGREGWSIIFRHPVRQEATGKPGKRVRRGLGTRDQAEAERLVADMNVLLSDNTYWNPAARTTAERRFDPRIVEIFYYQMVPEKTDYAALREEYIALPTSIDSNYRRVLLLGTTGAGKTTLVRQLIGTDPVKERFPSTSTAKTTVADTEIVLGDAPYKAVVTFLSRDEVREYLEECISEAVLSAYRKADRAEILRRLLRHVSQRLRFNYVLGNGPIDNEDDDDLDDEDDEFLEETETGVVSSETFGDIDLQATNDLLESVVERLRDIAERQGEKLLKDVGGAEDESDERIVEQLLQEEIDERVRADEAFHEVADQLMDEIEQRFDLLETGELHHTKQGWPLSWSWATEDREAFIRAILRFSSNFAPLFGLLLTPLVNGIRVAGPFVPSWSSDDQPKLVLIDGEGLGHTPESATSISTSVTQRFGDIDAVLLVDNATQPMQAAPTAALETLASSGIVAKLVPCFTHFDAVKGDNLLTVSAKKQHVLASVENVLVKLGEDTGYHAERALRRRFENCFFVGGIQEPLDTGTKRGRRTISELQDLLVTLAEIIDLPEPVPSRPVYDRMNLAIAVRAAAENFHNAWLPRLGLGSKPDVHKEHWTRVKALTRRLANGWEDEYDTLKPVADLRRQLQKEIYRLIQEPVRWTSSQPSEDEMELIFNLFADKVRGGVIDLTTERLWTERIQQWQEAFSKHGRGSTFVRADIIAGDIYQKAAPVPDVTPSPDRNRFLHEVSTVVDEAAQAVDVELI